MTADILDDLFPACALAAFLEQAAIEQGWPDSEATRRRAYQIYEEALAVKNGGAPRPGNRHKDEFPVGQIAQRLDLVEFADVDTLESTRRRSARKVPA